MLAWFDSLSQRRKILVSCTVGFSVFVLLAVMGFKKLDSLRDEVIDSERNLSASYSKRMMCYAQFETGAKEKLAFLKFADNQQEEIRTRMLTAINIKDITVGSKFHGAAVKLFPELQDLRLYDDFVRLLQTGRNRCANIDAVFVDERLTYQTWIDKGMTKSFIYSVWIKPPTERLVVQIGPVKLTGQDALNKMEESLVTEATIETFKTGILQPVIPQ